MSILISNFGDLSANGVYAYYGEVSDQPAYKKGDYYLMYKKSNGPYCFVGSYYLCKLVVNYNAVPILKYLYRADVTDFSDLPAAEWTTYQDPTSGEIGIGDVDFLSDSSSGS